MKTLDEVIAELEDEGLFADALFYLKVLQKMQKAQPLEKSEWNELYNQPLTWDELKGMEGKPVWITWTVRGEWHHGDWNLVNAQLGDRVWLVDGNGEEFDLLKDVQGVMWQAYRKERE